MCIILLRLFRCGTGVSFERLPLGPLPPSPAEDSSFEKSAALASAGLSRVDFSVSVVSIFPVYRGVPVLSS